MNNLDNFLELYANNLTDAIKYHPLSYSYGINDVPRVIARYRVSLIEKTYSKEGEAFKATCRGLGIKHTYAAINTYLKGSN